jgi:anthranilate phosphoribosyltransferase
MDIQQALKKVIAREDLGADEMRAVMRQIMTGEATPAQIGGFLVALRMKGETVDEISAAAGVMRELATRVETRAEHLVDTCGTGGDASGSFNVSTAAALVAAGAGAHVAKHGNRSVSSSSGSADVLEAAGVNLDVPPEVVGRCIDEVGVGFLFAQKHHSAMRHAIGPRREMAVRTIFNVLGPLTNPAGAPNQVMGVFDAELVEPIARVLGQLGSRHVMVVHADDGMDEISICAPTRVAELKDGEVSGYRIAPEDFGFERADAAAIRVGSAAESLAMIRSVLDDQPGPARDIVCLNAGAAIYTAGLAGDLAGGIEQAKEAIASGRAREVLERLVAATRAA